MALQPIITQILQSMMPTSGFTHSSSTNLDAAGEYLGMVGQISLKAGSGSKTLSSAGGHIYWTTGAALVWSDPATTVRLGIQDIDASGFPDGTYDVHADLVAGTDTIVQAAMYRTAMESGTKTITHGDIVAIVMTMISKGGSDMMNCRFITAGQWPFVGGYYPYKVTNTGTPAKANTAHLFTIEFDDGTTGWIEPYPLGFNASATTPTSITFNSSSSPDEYAAIFRIPYAATLSAIGAHVGGVAITDDFELILYTDPLGTPAVHQAIAIDADLYGSTGNPAGLVYRKLSSPLNLSPNTDYAVAIRPTTTNNVLYGHLDLGSGFEPLKDCTFAGRDLILGGRTNQTGAFVETDPDHLPLIWLGISALSDNVGGGSGYGGPRGQIHFGRGRMRA